MADYIIDNFTGGSGGNLAGRTPDTLGDGSFFKHPVFAADLIVHAGGYVTGTVVGSTGIYGVSTDPGADPFGFAVGVEANAGDGWPGGFCYMSPTSASFVQAAYRAQDSVLYFQNTYKSYVATIPVSAPVSGGSEIAVVPNGDDLDVYWKGSLIHTEVNGTVGLPTTGVVSGIRARGGDKVHYLVGTNAAVGGGYNKFVPACWTFFSAPVAVEDSAGRVHIQGMVGADVRHNVMDVAGESNTSFTFPLGEQDDHNNGAIDDQAPDGRIRAWYSKHNDTTGERFRVETVAGDPSAWDAEVVLPLDASSRPISYSNPIRLTADPGGGPVERTFVFFRSGQGAGTSALSYTFTDNPNYTQSSDFSTRQQVVADSVSPDTPYYRFAKNGANRVDVLATDRHPNNPGVSSVFHFYGVFDGTALNWFKSDGTPIVGLFSPSDGTLIHDGASVKAWIWDIWIDSNGFPRVLYTTFPSTTDHRLNTKRWTGSAWSAAVQIVAQGTHLYSPEVYYSAGACFVSDHVVVAGRESGGQWGMFAFATQDDGDTWAESETLLDYSASKTARPHRVEGASSATADNVVVWRGEYNTYIDYTTNAHLLSVDSTAGSATAPAQVDFKIDHVRIQAPGTTGSVDYTIANFGDVQAVAAMMGFTYGLNPSPSTHAGFSCGIWDGTNQRSVGVRSIDNLNPTRCARAHSHTALLCRPSTDILPTLIPVAQITGAVTDGITINWLEAIDWEVELLFVRAASGRTAIAKALSTTGTSNPVALSHNCNGLLAFNVGLSAVGAGTENLITLGAAKWDGTTTTQAFASFYSQNAASTVANGQIIKDNAVAGQPVATTETWNATAVMSANQVDFQTNTTSTGGDIILGLAFALADPDDFHVGIVDTPATTGAHAYTGLPHTPGFAAAIGTRLTAVNTLTSDANASGWSVSTSNGTTHGTLGFSSKDGQAAASSIEASYSNALPLAVYDGDQNTAYSANAVAFSASEVEYTFDVADPTPRKMLLITAAAEPVNSAPVITSDGGGATATINAAENQTAVTTVVATDADPGDTIVYSIIGGADAALFGIGSSSGILAFLVPPDFENPTDANTDGVYEVTVQASDGTDSDTQAISVTVTDVFEESHTTNAATAYNADESYGNEYVESHTTNAATAYNADESYAASYNEVHATNAATAYNADESYAASYNEVHATNAATAYNADESYAASYNEVHATNAATAYNADESYAASYNEVHAANAATAYNADESYGNEYVESHTTNVVTAYNADESYAASYNEVHATNVATAYNADESYAASYNEVHATNVATAYNADESYGNEYVENHATNAATAYNANESYAASYNEVHATNVATTYNADESYAASYNEVHATNVATTYNADESYGNEYVESHSTNVATTYNANESYAASYNEVHATNVATAYNALDTYLANYIENHTVNTVFVYNASDRSLAIPNNILIKITKNNYTKYRQYTGGISLIYHSVSTIINE